MMAYKAAFRDPLVPFSKSGEKRDAPYHILNDLIIRKSLLLNFSPWWLVFFSPLNSANKISNPRGSPTAHQL